jgi:DNA processing protein
MRAKRAHPTAVDSNAAKGLMTDELEDTLRLAMVSGVGPRLRRALLERFGTPGAVFQAAASDLAQTPGIGPILVQRIVEGREQIDARAEIALARAHGIAVLPETSETYPRLLHEIHDPPSLLFLRGSLLPDDALAVAIVGSRHASHYGIVQAERLASSLARMGLVIVSGLARGVDAAAHRGALLAGGRTLAVLASGLLNIYPPEHQELAGQVQAQGALLSEMPLRFAPLSGIFPQRNRIISGLALGVIVVEAADRSGALITAQHAMEQGREVFAVPGRIDSRLSRGCHRLIRDGARLVQSAEDVIEELGPLVEGMPRADGSIVRHPAELQLNELETTVLQAIGAEPTLIDLVASSSGLPVHRVLATISVLEMRRLVKRISGNQVVRA